MSRYRVPDPLCNHVRKGRVVAGDPHGPHASTNVCDRQECIVDAMKWAYAVTRDEPRHIPDAEQ